MFGEDTPNKLHSHEVKHQNWAVTSHEIRVNCALKAGDEHHALRRPGGCTTSQISFEYIRVKMSGV